MQAGKRDSWAIFLQFTQDFTPDKVRIWITDVWGAAIAASIAESILTVGVKKATNAQLALGGVIKVTGTVSAIVRSFAEDISQSEVNRLVV